MVSPKTTSPPSPYQSDDISTRCRAHEKLADRVRGVRDTMGELRIEMKEIRKQLRLLMLLIGIVGGGVIGVPEIIEAIRGGGL